MTKPGFELYHSDIVALSALTDAQLGRLIRLLKEYSETGRLPVIPAELEIAFAFLQQKVDLGADKYRRITERNRKNGVANGTHSHPVAPNGTQDNPVGTNEIKRNEMKRKEKYKRKESGKLPGLQYEQRDDPLDDLYTDILKVH